MQAKDIMTTSVISVPLDGTIADAVRLMLDHHVSALPVVDAAGNLKGLISEGACAKPRTRAGPGGSRCWAGCAKPRRISFRSTATMSTT